MPITASAEQNSRAVIGRLLCVLSVKELCADLGLGYLHTISLAPVKQEVIFQSSTFLMPRTIIPSIDRYKTLLLLKGVFGFEFDINEPLTRPFPIALHLNASSNVVLDRALILQTQA